MTVVGPHFGVSPRTGMNEPYTIFFSFLAQTYNTIHIQPVSWLSKITVTLNYNRT